mmetsp:Transcript_11785/g.19185  ORF Transcript_11785/g.19185 Transcript_11785/m.19185 type:complete len:373 (+) Transcript_11785:413-1531(+)
MDLENLSSFMAAASLHGLRLHSTDTPYSANIVLRVATASGNGMDAAAGTTADSTGAPSTAATVRSALVSSETSGWTAVLSSTEMDRSALVAMEQTCDGNNEDAESAMGWVSEMASMRRLATISCISRGMVERESSMRFMRFGQGLLGFSSREVVSRGGSGRDSMPGMMAFSSTKAWKRSSTKDVSSLDAGEAEGNGGSDIDVVKSGSGGSIESPSNRESTRSEEGFQSGMMGRSSITTSSRLICSTFLRLLPDPNSGSTNLAARSAPGDTTGDGASPSSLTDTFLTRSVSSSIFLVMEAIRRFIASISDLRLATSSGDLSGNLTTWGERPCTMDESTGRGTTGAVVEEEEPAAEGVRLISVRRSFLPLRNFS